MDHHKFSKAKSSPRLYFAVAFGWSWLFWIPLAISGIHVSKTPATICFVIGLFGPSFSAILLTYLLGDDYEKHEFWDRLVNPIRITPRWYAILLLIAPTCSLLAIITGLALHAASPHFDTVIRYINNPVTIIPFILTILIYGPLPEEIGWRGYALDRLQENHSAALSSIILGTVWSIWHLPMFFINGSIMSEVFPLWSTQFWLAMGPGILATSIIMTWIYNNTRRSILGAIMLHFMMNFMGELLRLPGDYKNFQFIWIISIAILIVIFSGATQFERRKKN